MSQVIQQPLPSATAYKSSYTLLPCYRMHPMRVPAWRWERALGVASQQQPGVSKSLDGDHRRYITRAVSFYRRYQRVASNYTLAKLIETFSDIYWAHYIYHEQPVLRNQLEAMVLADVPVESIAAEFQLAVDVVTAYEKLFFDVRDSLSHEFFVINTVLTPHADLRERDYGLVWKMYGYYMGVHVLRLLISKFSKGVRCENPESAGISLQTDMVNVINLKANMAAKTVNVNSSTQMRLLEMFIAFLEVEKSSGDANAGSGMLFEAIEGVLHSIRVSVDGNDPANNFVPMDMGDTKTYDYGSRELRADELLRLTVGGNPPVIEKTSPFSQTVSQG